MIGLLVLASRRATSFQPLAQQLAFRTTTTTTTTSVSRIFSTLGEDTEGRRIRRRSGSVSEDNDDWSAPSSSASSRNTRNDDDDDWGAPKSSSRGGGGGWDDEDTDWNAPAPKRSWENDKQKDDNSWNNSNDNNNRNRSSRSASKPARSNYDNNRQSQPPRGRRSNNNNNYNDNNRSGNSRSGNERSGQRRNNDYSSSRNENSNFRSGGGGGRRQPNDQPIDKTRSINMKDLESAGFVHLYGLSSILNALETDRRDFTTIVEKSATNSMFDDGEEEEFDFKTREPPKPQAMFRPYLFVQDQQRRMTTRKGQKASSAEKVMELAQERNIPVEQVDKGILNTLSGNRPHQGFVLRCGKLYFESLSRIPLPDNDDESTSSSPPIWLVLDEVVDPQNLGALLRSAYFLGGGKKMGVLVCAKNSAPPTPVVSAASAGALEVLDVYSTTNLPRTLSHAREDGFRIVGASSSVPSTSSGADDAPPLYDLHDMPTSNDVDDARPILLVLGSEGHGLRTLVAKACTEFVRIPAGSSSIDDNSADDDDAGAAGVDSLNVSVTGGILLWQLLNGAKR